MKALVALIAFAMSSTALACEGLQVSDPWIREAPPGADVMAGYAQLHNASKASITIDGARGSDFGGVEMHRTEMENGKMRMHAEPRILLEPDATVSFEPGGLHLMLFDPRRALKAGDHVTLKLDCGQQSKRVAFTVRSEP